MQDKLRKSETRIEYIDVLRGLAIILMIMGHLDFGQLFDHYIHVFHMAIWFFISGWFYKTNSFNMKFVQRKMHSLLIPYMFWGLLQYPAWLLLNQNASNKLEPLVNLFFINTNLVMPIAGALWFLTCLFFAEIFWSFIETCIASRRIKILLIVSMISFGYMVPKEFHIRLPWAMDVSLVALGFIFLAYVLKKQYNKIFVYKLFNLNILEILFLGIINAVGIFSNGYVNLRMGEYACFILFWLNAIIAIIVLWNFSRIFSKRLKTCFIINEIRFIGKNSIIYLVLNQLFVLFANRIINYFDVTYFGIIYVIRIISLIIIMLILHYLVIFLNDKRFSWTIGK